MEKKQREFWFNLYLRGNSIHLISFVNVDEFLMHNYVEQSLTNVGAALANSMDWQVNVSGIK